MVRLKTRTMQGRIIGLLSDTTWESEFENVGIIRKSDDSNTTIVPTGYLVQPINEEWGFGFTILGSGFSDDLGDWPGRYFIEDYDLIYVNAFPSLAYRLNDQLSLAASTVLTGIYHEFENNHAVTFDVNWSDFSNFKLSGIYIDGNSIADNDASYQDIWTVSASYSWPVNERLMLGVSGL
jgi:long-subunit fatty acid transport protein